MVSKCSCPKCVLLWPCCLWSLHGWGKYCNKTHTLLLSGAWGRSGFSIIIIMVYFSGCKFMTQTLRIIHTHTHHFTHAFFWVPPKESFVRKPWSKNFPCMCACAFLCTLLQQITLCSIDSELFKYRTQRREDLEPVQSLKAFRLWGSLINDCRASPRLHCLIV